MSRSEAAEALSAGTSINGRFLVRTSDSAKEFADEESRNYVLSVVWDSRIFHHLITGKDGIWLVNGHKIGRAESLDAVIQKVCTVIDSLHATMDSPKHTHTHHHTITPHTCGAGPGLGVGSTAAPVKGSMHPHNV